MTQHSEQYMPARLNKKYYIQNVSSIDFNALKTFPYEYPGKDIVVNIETDEFTAVCPWSGLPDFATIHIDYVPSKAIIELRSLKYYLHSFRNVGIYQEHLVNRLLEDLLRVASPKWMKVTVDYRIRGGIHTIASREFRKAKRR